MQTRAITPLLRQRLAAYPAVALVGPRQCGKTTLARAHGGAYFDLEQPAERLRLDVEWDRLAKARELVVLDEAHAWPEVFPRLRGAIDAKRKRNGRYLLLGSVSPALMMQVSESLAGRLSIIELTPLLQGELIKAAQRDRLWLCGGFPDGGVLTPAPFPQWQQDYLALMTQRDLPAWGLPAKPQVTQRLLHMLAAMHGQPWNASLVAKGLGLTYHTVNGYLDFLEGAYLLRRLPPWTANIGKRITKAPKVYWRDSGLLHATLGIATRENLLRHPRVGASWEGFVIEQVLGCLTSRGKAHRAFSFRTSDQHELDLLIETAGELWAFEIKLTTAPSPHDLASLNKLADALGARRRVLVTQAAAHVQGGTTLSCNLAHLLEVMPSW